MKLALLITTVIAALIAIPIAIANFWVSPKPVPRYHEFRLDDGTRCVITYRGAVDCDWRKK